LDNGESLQVKDFAERFEEKGFKKIGLRVQGKKKLYHAIDSMIYGKI
jgi:hypothetical protein